LENNMADYTRYSMEVDGIKTDEELKAFEYKLRELDLIGYIFDDGPWKAKNGIYQWGHYDEQDWKACEETMRLLGKTFPKFTFKLMCYGEGIDDNWVLYLKNNVWQWVKAECIAPAPDWAEWRGDWTM